jgi:hypothetical protein
MNKLVSSLALAALALAGVAQADVCTIEATPAATLLLPYFEVDIDDPNGIDTFMSVNNAREYSVIGHVIVWTDMSVEALDFNIYLTGYDVQTIGMGLIIRNGIIPRTGDANSVSPRGSFSDAHLGTSSAIDYGACPSFWPYAVPALDADFLNHLQSILTGGPSSIYNGRCGGFPFDDGIARGYVTIDVVQDCTLLTPCDLGYFVTNGGFVPAEMIGDWDNALWGDWYMVDYANDFAQGDTLVHVEAFFPQVLGATLAVDPFPAGVDFAPEGATFWGRCSTFAHVLFPAPPIPIVFDFREPLGTTYATRFYQNAAFSGGTDFLVWRDSLFNVFFGEEDGFSCANGPAWFPLNERQVVFFDEQENPDEACTVSPCPQADILFPLEAQRVSVSDLDLVQDSGWMYANLNQLWAFELAPGVVIPSPMAAQAWVEAVHSAEGRFSAGLPAVQLDSMCDFVNIHIGPSGPDFPADEASIFPTFLQGFVKEGASPTPRPAGIEPGEGTVRNVLP